MDKLIIRGGNRLSGTIPISGAKNAALTLIPCALLTEEPLTLRNLPRLADIDGFQHLMNQFGVTTVIQGTRPEDFGRVMSMEATRITSTVAPYDLVRKMRADFDAIAEIVYGESGNVYPEGKAMLVYSRLTKRLQINRTASFGEYIRLVANNAAERRIMVNLLTTNHTYFYREEHHYDDMYAAQGDEFYDGEYEEGDDYGYGDY